MAITLLMSGHESPDLFPEKLQKSNWKMHGKDPSTPWINIKVITEGAGGQTGRTAHIFVAQISRERELEGSRPPSADRGTPKCAVGLETNSPAGSMVRPAFKGDRSSDPLCFWCVSLMLWSYIPTEQTHKVCIHPHRSQLIKPFNPNASLWNRWFVFEWMTFFYLTLDILKKVHHKHISNKTIYISIQKIVHFRGSLEHSLHL